MKLTLPLASSIREANKTKTRPTNADSIFLRQVFENFVERFGSVTFQREALASGSMM